MGAAGRAWGSDRVVVVMSGTSQEGAPRTGHVEGPPAQSFVSVCDEHWGAAGQCVCVYVPSMTARRREGVGDVIGG